MHTIVCLTVAAGLLSSSTAFAQTLSLGAVAGVNVTGDFRNASYTFPVPDSTVPPAVFAISSGPRTLVIGPKLELRWSRHFSLEAEALHRELRSSTTTLLSQPIVFPDGMTISRLGPEKQVHTTWEFPVLTRYRWETRKLHPFVESGLALRPAGTGTGISHYGIATGAGLEMSFRSLLLSPQVRYTRWASFDWLAPEALRNQVEFLIGVSRPSTSAHPMAFGIRPSIGIVAGAGLTGGFPAQGPYPSERNYAVGMMVVVYLPRRFSIEVDGIYRPLILSEPEHDPVLTWEFPVLTRYTFGERRARPFVALGPSFRAIGNLNGTNPSHYGAATAAGVETRWRALRLTPSIRYTRWQRDPGATYLRTIQNQVELLVGFSF